MSPSLGELLFFTEEEARQCRLESAAKHGPGLGLGSSQGAGLPAFPEDGAPGSEAYAPGLGFRFYFLGFRV